MNNENQQEQETKEQKTGNFWQDKLAKFKNLVTNAKLLESKKIKILYIIALSLQALFLIFQFIPIMEVATQFKISLFGAKIHKVENRAMIRFPLPEQLNGFFFYVLYIVSFILFLCSFNSTITYFVRKRCKMEKGFFLIKLSVICMLGSMGLGIKALSNWAEEMETEYHIAANEIFTVIQSPMVLYVVIGILLLIVVWYLSIIRKQKERMGELYL